MKRLRALSVTVLSALAISPQALAQASDAAASGDAAENAKALDLIVVTGTRSNKRTIRDSLSPIDVLPLETLESSGTPELNVALSRVLPSFNFARTSITDGTDTVRPAQLRSLAPDQVLVLVNGKRRHTTAIVNVNGSQGRGSSPVDLNAIPFHAVERIEVLRDGAAAQYGSDAIAGVINVVLKKSSEGGSGDLRYGKTSAGDGELIHGGADAGFAIGEAGWINFAAEYRDRAATNRALPDLRDPREPTYATVNHHFGDGDSEDRLFFVNTQLPINESVEFYGFANLSQRDAIHAGFYRRALDARNIRAIYPDGFLPQFDNSADDTAVVGGVRGVTEGGWAWDVSANYGRSEFEFNIFNSLNTSVGPTSQTEFYAGRLESNQKLLNIDFVNTLDFALPNPINVAFGGEYRKEEFSIGAGEPNSYFGTGAQVFPGFRPGDAGSHGRHNGSAYLDLETDLSDRASLSGALRFEDYSDFGSTTSGKISGRFAFNDAIALRATASTGFRAPSLSQQFYSTTATNFIGGVPFDIRTFSVDSPVAIALGAEPLQAEESTNLGLGLQIEPTDALYLTVDAYQIKVDDRIVLSENLTGAAVRAFLTRNGIANTDGGRYFTNAIDTRTRGIDLLATYKFDLGDAGKLDLTLGGNVNDTEVQRIAPNPDALAGSGLNLQRIGRVEVGRIEEGTPKSKLMLTGDYSNGAWRLVSTLTRWGKVTELNTNPVQDQTYGSEVTLDFSLSWNSPSWTLTLGSDNVTDEYPDQVIAANSFSGILPYSRGTAPFGFNGAFWYGKAAYRW